MRAGADSLKGLCPFHDEKSPSFHVRPNHGHFHCFRLRRGWRCVRVRQKIEHVSFVEAVELLADRVGYTVTYTGGVGDERAARHVAAAAGCWPPTPPRRSSTPTALQSDEAAPARQYLLDRNFDTQTAAHFGCGVCPVGLGHADKASAAARDLSSRSSRPRACRARVGADRWTASTGVCCGRSGPAAARSSASGRAASSTTTTMEAKYINTPETVLYKKSSVLFGLDLAKRDIAKGHQAVVVEGYTDVMAMHLAGVTTAVASCGTAFGDEHLGDAAPTHDGRQLLSR